MTEDTYAAERAELAALRILAPEVWEQCLTEHEWAVRIR